MKALSGKLKQCGNQECDNQFEPRKTFQSGCCPVCEIAIKRMKQKTATKTLRRSTKTRMRQGGLPSATQSELALWTQLRELGCAVSLFTFNQPTPGVDIHHILSGGKRISHRHVIPLKPIFHRQGTEQYPSLHSINGGAGGKKAFKLAYGFDEYELLELCEDALGYRYRDAA